MVTLAEIQAQAASLPEEDRASLASFLLETLGAPDYDVSDEEVAERAKELASGKVAAISLAELRAGVFADLGRE